VGVNRLSDHEPYSFSAQLNEAVGGQNFGKHSYFLNNLLLHFLAFVQFNQLYSGNRLFNPEFKHFVRGGSLRANLPRLHLIGCRVDPPVFFEDHLAEVSVGLRALHEVGQQAFHNLGRHRLLLAQQVVLGKEVHHKLTVDEVQNDGQVFRQVFPEYFAVLLSRVN
jgi:hypothetical protein